MKIKKLDTERAISLFKLLIFSEQAKAVSVFQETFEELLSMGVLVTFPVGLFDES